MQLVPPISVKTSRASTFYVRHTTCWLDEGGEMPATMVHSVYTSLVWSTMYRRKSGISVLAGSIKRPLGWDDFRPMLTHVKLLLGRRGCPIVLVHRILSRPGKVLDPRQA